MVPSKSPRSLWSILTESTKLLAKNGKTMSFIALFAVILTSSVFFLFVRVLEYLAVNMFITHQQDFMPNVPGSFDMPNIDPRSVSPTVFALAQFAGPLRHLREDLSIIITVEIIQALAFVAIFFISTVSTILVSSSSYQARNVSLPELFALMRTTWPRALVTTFYTSTLGTGCSFTIIIFPLPFLMYYSTLSLSIAILVGAIAFSLYLYLSVAWAMAVVVSVVEGGICGLKALGKAAGLVEGKMLHGFLINACYNLVVWILVLTYNNAVLGAKGFVGEHPIAAGSVRMGFLVLANMFVAVVYTVYYFECREYHGEGVIEYNKVPSVELRNDMA